MPLLTVTHAAVTAIQNAYKKKEDPVDTTLYTTHYPSSRDAVFMLEAGVKEMVYLVKNKDWRARYKTQATKRLFHGKIKSRYEYIRTRDIVSVQHNLFYYCRKVYIPVSK